MNSLYFGFIAVGAFLEQWGLLRVYEWHVGEVGFVEGTVTPWVVVNIFVFNLFVSGFLVTTASGLAFFVFPVGVLVLRALMWGVFLNQLPTPRFLAAFPTLILEGEGYVLAAVCGVNLGLSWLKPDWAFGGAGLSRAEAFREALGECVRLYALVAVLLFAAAIVEAVTIIAFAG
jgi:hypothetical protein